MFAFYLHDISPIVFRFGDSLAIHWYGLAYVLGFYVGYLILVHLARRQLSPLKPDQVADFVTLVALFGVILGGRLGYILLYGLSEYRDTPLEALKLWKGGMASHGAILGIALFCLWYARKHNLSWAGIGDTLVCAAPPGVFFGRMANFINGELFGRVSQVPWAVQFPTELLHEDYLKQGGTPVELPPAIQHSPDIIAYFEQTRGGREELISLLHPRHPSQIYEALGEGLFLFALLFFLRTRYPRLPQGIITGIFFLSYAIIRIVLESYRQPDSGSDLILGLTKGQFYSTFMIIVGASFVVHGLWRQRSTQT